MPNTEKQRFRMYAIQAVKGSGGSYKTQHNHLREAQRFVGTLRQIGFGVQKWSNITNKHVGAVVDHGRKVDGLKTATLKEYLSGVRLVVNHFGNDRIAADNAAFGIENRFYVTNEDKSLSQDIFEKTVAELKASNDINDNRIAAQLLLQRHLGLHKEESFKLNPGRAVLKDGRAFISDGTKGGRDRLIQSISEKAIAAIEYTKSVVSGTNTIAKGMTERQWNNRFYRTLKAYGITKDQAGASAHGLRHAYAQERYQQLTGFAPPVKFKFKEDFRANAEQNGGPSWQMSDQDARLIIKGELGHGPDRDDVVSQYLGSG